MFMITKLLVIEKYKSCSLCAIEEFQLTLNVNTSFSFFVYYMQKYLHVQ